MEGETLYLDPYEPYNQTLFAVWDHCYDQLLYIEGHPVALNLGAIIPLVKLWADDVEDQRWIIRDLVCVGDGFLEARHRENKRRTGKS